MTAAWIAAVTATVVALMSALLSYNTTRRLSRRSNQLAFVDRQLSELYGPLLALSRASAASWVEFRKRYGANRRALFSSHTPPAEDDVRAWRYWLKHVFMPINRKMFDTILTKTDLIEGEEIPQSFVDFCAHVTGYEVTLAQWEDDDYSNLGSVINHPGRALEEHIDTKYKELKLRQRSLLGNALRTDHRRWPFNQRVSRNNQLDSNTGVAPSADAQQRNSRDGQLDTNKRVAPSADIQRAKSLWSEHLASSSSDSTEYVEAAFTGESILIRNSLDSSGSMLSFSLRAWKAFLIGVREGEFDFDATDFRRDDK